MRGSAVRVEAHQPYKPGLPLCYGRVVPLDAGTRVGRYTISRLLAQGGMAEVYRADQELARGITRPVAVKVIRPEYSESSDFREMFLDEARTACTLSHPNIVQIYDVGESDDGLLYMAMELVSGETLATINRTLRDHSERFSDEALFAIGIWTASALEAVHALKTEKGSTGLVHRDVSPHNLLLSTSGSLKLIDFGIAKAATNRNLTMPGVTKGKAGYFSPEQAMGKRLDGRSDLFSLGVTLYKLACGSTPFDDHKTHGERHAALVRGQWKDLDEVFPGLPPPFYDVVRRALMVKPEERYQTAAELREALEKAAFDSGFRVGQSALQGYVDVDGEITASGGTRSSAFPALTEPPTDATLKSKTPTAVVPKRPARKDTERIAAQRPGRRLLLAVAFVAALVIGVFGSLLLLRATDEPEPRLEPVTTVIVEPPPTPPEVTPAPLEVPDMDLSEPGPAPTPEPKKPPVAARPPKPVEKPPEPKLPVEPKPDPKPVEVAKPTLPQDIGDGEGTLRIALQGNDVGARVLVRGAKTFEETPPFNDHVPAGLYTVVVRLGDGSLSPQWRGPVRPNDLRKLTYDVAQEKWTER